MKKELDLANDKISKLLFSFSIPCVVGMLINSIYNIVDQIFIGKGVGTLGNAATNVIFPLVIICNAISGLIGNGASANLSLQLGEKNIKKAKESIGSSITLTFIVAIIFGVLSYIFLPKLVYLFGCTESVYPYAIKYGKIISIGIPFMIIYSSLSNIIRADGSPQYSMKLLVIGAIINIILDPIFIFGFNMGVEGGAIATIIGQIVSFIIAILYIGKIKSVKLTKKDFVINKNIFRTLALGVSSFITQLTVLVLFIFMNNMMTRYGAYTKYGSDIPLAVYGVMSKVNSLFISSVLGIAIGSQPIIGFNYGAGNYQRVKETLKKVLTINFLIGIFFNVLFVLFPNQIVNIFISPKDPTYELFVEFACLLCKSLYMVIALNALEMTTSITVQSLGNVLKATFVSFARQIILFIPIASLLGIVLNKGIYGILYAGAISDTICFILCIFVFRSEYKKLDKKQENKEEVKEYKNNSYQGKKIVITIAREYGSGGHYIGELLAKKLGINFYDKEIISLTAKESGLSENYIKDNEQKKKKFNNLTSSHMVGLDNEDKIFIEESNLIKKLADENSCVIVGRCADFILKDYQDVINIFIYSDIKNKINRAINYYNISEEKALKEINKINKDRANHYKYYTNKKWDDPNNYNLCINSDFLGIDGTVELIENFVLNKINK
jgi:putative MATE family efflux protein